MHRLDRRDLVERRVDHLRRAAGSEQRLDEPLPARAIGDGRVGEPCEEGLARAGDPIHIDSDLHLYRRAVERRAQGPPEQERDAAGVARHLEEVDVRDHLIGRREVGPRVVVGKV